MKTLSSILRLYWKHYPGWFLVGIGVAYLTAIASITLLATAGWFLGATALAGVTGALAFNTVYPGFLIRTAALTRTVSRYAERVLSHDATFRFLARMRLYVFDGIAQMPFRRLRDFRSGELLARLTADIDALDGLYLRVVMPLSTAFLAVLVLFFVLFGFNPALALVTGGILLASIIIMPMHAGRIGVLLGRRLAFTSEALRLRYIDLMRGQLELIMAGRLGDQQGAVAKAARRIKALQYELNGHDLRGRAIMSIASGLALVACLIMAALAYEDGTFTAPLVLLAVLAVFTMTELLVPIRRGLLDIGKVIYAGQRVLPLMAEQATEAESDLTDRGDVELAVDQVTFAYSDHAEPIFKSFDLALKSGEAIGIIGTSGAGKSTLLALVAGLLEPLDGEVSLSYSDPAARNHPPRLGLLTQRTELFRESLAFNLRIGDATASDEALQQAMEEAELAKILNRLPEGLEQSLGDDGQGLSGGESRRMALARLLLFKPDLWLLDEATEGLDSVTAASVLETLRQATRNKALLFVTHKQREAELADKLLIVSEETPPRLITRADKAEWQEHIESLR